MNQKDSDKNALHGALETIVDEISYSIASIPQFTDFAQEEPGFRLEQYIVSLIPENKDITVILTRKKTQKEYESFQHYWNESKKILTDANKPLGQKVLKNLEIFINFIQHYGFDLSNPEIRPIADLIQEITSRIHKYNTKYENNVREIPANAVINSANIETDTREAVYDLFLIPRTVQKIKRYEQKLDNEKPLRFTQRTGRR